MNELEKIFMTTLQVSAIIVLVVLWMREDGYKTRIEYLEKRVSALEDTSMDYRPAVDYE